jgi:hypothetical protein
VLGRSRLWICERHHAKATSQPTARRFKAEELNAASVFFQTRDDAYNQAISDLRAELRLYAPTPNSLPAF